MLFFVSVDDEMLVGKYCKYYPTFRISRKFSYFCFKIGVIMNCLGEIKGEIANNVRIRCKSDAYLWLFMIAYQINVPYLYHKNIIY